ncbi:ketosteroid isomerase-like protein [Granulicella aggregans]|uniref:Ketosteroid isomerase-like protein n=1 Tax=Granulicella aggregans TaxID=474949 RepID=A0A7W8E288_9BACT|nr:nuclear transport factor 2 family protein [Granulicella aggregans]MBB5056643.1 ketosteroid isomerase-like protein [Granulicella aggregans]
MDNKASGGDSNEIQQILERWAETTRIGQLDEVLKNHASDALIYDVLPPMKYEGADTYRRSWGDWHPDTPSDGQFELQDLAITAGNDVAFAHGFIQCGGTAPNGKVFSDLVRATFCLRKSGDGWKIQHQHISKPLNLK